MADMTRRAFIGAIGAAGIAGMAVLGGCGGAGQSAGSSGVQSASEAASSASVEGKGASLVVGTLATEDILPLWAAQADGLFEETGLEAQVVTFQSATELIAGVASGEVDVAMTDIMVTASMVASGVDVQMLWVTLGQTADQGRFGIMVGPESEVKSLAELAGVPIGVGSNTILEYVMDKLMESAGVPADQVVVEELQKLPVRYQAMASGEVEAAALPATLLALGEASGCTLVADDTGGENLSQSVMIARSSLLSDQAYIASIDALREAWDQAAEAVNADPEAYRAVLVENANLPEEIADTYRISEYPLAQLPSSAMVDPVLAWMEEKGYLSQPLAYDQATGVLS